MWCTDTDLWWTEYVQIHYYLRRLEGCIHLVTVGEYKYVQNLGHGGIGLIQLAAIRSFAKRDNRKNDATCIEFAVKAAERRPSHPCTNLSEVHVHHICCALCPIKLSD